MAVETLSEELARVRADFARRVNEMTPAQLSQPTVGTRWTNRQLLFHMVFGYLVVLRLLWLVKVLGRLPRPVRRAFAATLNAVTRPFHWINYWGSVGGGRVVTPARMVATLDRTTAKIESDATRQGGRALTLGMDYPTDWDPYFHPYMTLADVYRYPTQHYDHHTRQLSVQPR